MAIENNNKWVFKSNAGWRIILTSNAKSTSSARFIGVVGMPNSGKDTCAKYLEENFDYLSIRMSSIVVEEAKKRTGKEPDRQLLQEIGAELRRQHGNGVIAKRIVEDWIPWLTMNVERALKDERGAFDPKSLHFVFNGVRSSGEVEVFRKEFGNDFLLIAVCSSFETRYKRAIVRKRVGFDNFDRENFSRLDNADLQLGLGDALGLADHCIINEGTAEEMLQQIKKIIGR